MVNGGRVLAEDVVGEVTGSDLMQEFPPQRQPRWYQQSGIAAGSSPSCRNPLFIAPTGAGKTFLMSQIARRKLIASPAAKLVIVAHNTTLVRQTIDELRNDLPEELIGVYAAALGQRVANRPVTVAMVQTIYKVAAELGRVDVLFIDEAHRATGDSERAKMYPALLAVLRSANPELLVYGFTASPWRIGGRHIAHQAGEDNAGRIFDRIVDEVRIEDLIDRGDLCDLTSKATATVLDTRGVAICNGDFNRRQLAKRMTHHAIVSAAVAELVVKGADRSRWLIFCAGVSHAVMVQAALHAHGIEGAVVTGDTPDVDRQAIEGRLERGELRALLNVDVYAEGFNVRPIDLVALLRPTRSPTRYIQMVGRGARTSPATGKRNCLVLDFAGNVKRFGPINALRISFRESVKRGGGDQPTRACPACDEVLPINCRKCPQCGTELAELAIHDATASSMDIVTRRKPLARHGPHRSDEYYLAEIRRRAVRDPRMSDERHRNLSCVCARRFGSWVKAKRRAGVPCLRAGRGEALHSTITPQEACERIRAAKASGLIARNVPKSLITASKKLFGSWSMACSAAGVVFPRNVPKWDRERMLADIRHRSVDGIAPLMDTITYTRQFKTEFSSWAEACEAAGVKSQSDARRALPSTSIQ